MWEIRINHPGLNRLRVVRGATQQDAQQAAAMQLKAWDELWEHIQQRRLREHEREEEAHNKELRKALAEEQTKEAEVAAAALENLLRDAVERDHRIDWQSSKDNSDYPAPKPSRRELTPVPTEPPRSAFVPDLKWFTSLIPSVRKKREAQAEQRYRAAYSSWQATKVEVLKWNTKLLGKYKQQLTEWETQKSTWLEVQQQRNAAVDEKQAAYVRAKPSMIQEYCEMVLHASEYPETFPCDFQLDYITETRMLVADYSLPPKEALPTVKAYKYVATHDEIHPVPAPESWLNKTYESVLYQIVLRTLYELFQSDEAKALDAIVFNGWVRSIDKATGKETNACVLTVQASKAELLEINLAQVDPKTCFKKLKGISAARLTALSPVRPILQLNKEDKRFIQPHAVVDGVDSSTNLAAMDWEDFEHLIREVFEREFSKEGGEVKITRASRDGGVDGVVFDPDPIRGGKIVIQAKRYTNTVGVSAVRDLYGTILNEGANKGILVTTADYGPDAYELGKGKPITLLNGSELLYLLEKHGHKTRIDLAEARMLEAEERARAKEADKA